MQLIIPVLDNQLKSASPLVLPKRVSLAATLFKLDLQTVFAVGLLVSVDKIELA